MPATFTHTPPQKKRKEPGIGGPPPVDRRPTGGGGDGGGDDHWKNESHGPRELLLRVRFFVFSALAADMICFGILVAIYFAHQTGARLDTHLDPRSGVPLGDWRRVLLPSILYLNTAVLLLSSLTVELARRNIFREIDVMEEWLGLGRPALRRALPWLGATLGLGALFLAGQWTAWRQLTARGFAFSESSSPDSFFFYLITGLHAAHLLLGVAALIVCLSALGWLKRVEFRQVAVDATAWYWQAMVLAWLLLVGVLAVGQ